MVKFIVIIQPNKIISFIFDVEDGKKESTSVREKKEFKYCISFDSDKYTLVENLTHLTYNIGSTMQNAIKILNIYKNYSNTLYTPFEMGLGLSV